LLLGRIAEETVEIANRGWYTAPSGTPVPIADAVARAANGTRLYGPGDYDRLGVPAARVGPASLEVTVETTGEAVRRLVMGKGLARVVALNFASAKNPGGGFLGGAKAQEEDLARCSALYKCQLTQPAYDEANRACASMLYTDHLIYSPDVPFFRDERLQLLAEPFVASIITSPAPNAGEARRRGESERVRATLERRAAHVLAVAAHHGHLTLVLGAWGCGVFRNDPREVADVFVRLLTNLPYARAFDRVVFAIYDRSEARANFRAFEERCAFGGGAARRGSEPNQGS
jgi:uncharacterized protein (TIGR02452 family)